MKYAVEPLLDGDGPLGDLSVRLKLIYGLGVINRQEYEDAELLMALREELNHDGNEYAFTDDEILGPFGELHCVAAFPPPPQGDPAASSLYSMQIERDQTAVPAIVGICRSLQKTATGVAIIEIPSAADQQEFEAQVGIDIRWIARDESLQSDGKAGRARTQSTSGSNASK